jgi:hypothetical protein
MIKELIITLADDDKMSISNNGMSFMHLLAISEYLNLWVKQTVVDEWYKKPVTKRKRRTKSK